MTKFHAWRNRETVISLSGNVAIVSGAMHYSIDDVEVDAETFMLEREKQLTPKMLDGHFLLSVSHVWLYLAETDECCCSCGLTEPAARTLMRGIDVSKLPKQYGVNPLDTLSAQYIDWPAQ